MLPYFSLSPQPEKTTGKSQRLSITCSALKRYPNRVDRSADYGFSIVPPVTSSSLNLVSQTMSTPAMAPTNTKDSDTPGWLHRHGTSVLGSVARQACKQPIYTLVITALLATMTYTSLLEGSLYNANLTRLSNSHLNQLDVTDFLQGSRSLRLGKATAWQWETDDESMSDQEVRPSFFLDPVSNLLTSSFWRARLHRIWL